MVVRIYITFLVFFIVIFLLYFISFFFSCHSIRSALFFTKHLLQLAKINLKLLKCKVNLCNIASVQYGYLWMIASKNWLKRIIKITFLKKLFWFYLRRFLSQSLCFSLSWFPNKKIKLLNVIKNISFILIVTGLLRANSTKWSNKLK